MELTPPNNQDNLREVAIECRNVWKLFGTRANQKLKKPRGEQSLDAIFEHSYDKEELLNRHGLIAAVCNANFQIYEGETFCIMGLSGSGKSTLIRHFNRLIEPTRGEVIFRGTDVCQLSEADLRQMRSKHMGMVFQNVALLPWRSVLENVSLPLEVQRDTPNGSAAVKERCMAALERVGLGNWVNHYPRQLSGGMQQRVGIARALAADPEVLLMDEPFSALDPLLRKQLQLEFRQLSVELKKTTVFITHDLEEAIRIGDRIAIMKDGRIIQIGTPQQVVLTPADDYVAEFVEGISRLHLVKAHSVMKPIPDDERQHILNCPQADVNDDLQYLIDLCLESGAQGLRICDASTQDASAACGMVTREDLLRALSHDGEAA